MKTNRFAAAATATMLGLGAVLVAAGPASAEDYYIVDSELSEDSSGGGWYSSGDTYTSTDDGLVLTGDGYIGYSLDDMTLNGDSLIELVQSLSVDADGDWAFSMVFAGSNNDELIWGVFSPATDGTLPTGLDGEWVITNGETVYTLEELADLVDGWNEGLDAPPSLVALGVDKLEESDPVTVRSVSFDGDTYYFTPEPEAVEEGDEDSDEESDVDEAAPAVPVTGEATFTG